MRAKSFSKTCLCLLLAASVSACDDDPASETTTSDTAQNDARHEAVQTLAEACAGRISGRADENVVSAQMFEAEVGIGHRPH